MEDFDDHIVTEELKEAENNPSVSDSSLISKGNLFAAIGFEKGDKPTEDLRNFLKNNIQIQKTPSKIQTTKTKVSFFFKIKMPSKLDLNENFPTPDRWTSRSWIDIIENGFSQSLRKFIFKSESFPKGSNSRSTTGLQSKGKVSNIANFEPIKYISEIFENFKKKFN